MIGIITTRVITVAIITIIHMTITTNKIIIEVKVAGKIATEVVDISATMTISTVEIITGVVADVDTFGAVTVVEIVVETEEVEIGKIIKMVVHQGVAVEIVPPGGHLGQEVFGGPHGHSPRAFVKPLSKLAGSGKGVGFYRHRAYREPGS